jgi:CheY-like chemotaxis protein
MARVLALSADLLFGSRVQGALVGAGHEVELVGDERRLRERFSLCAGGAGDRDNRAADVLVADLTDPGLDGAAIVASLKAGGELGETRTLAFYSHVDAAARERAQRAGFDLVVARSRMAREGPELVARLLELRPPAV